MAIKLSDLDKELKKITNRIESVLKSGQLSKKIGEDLTKDIKRSMSIGKMPDGKKLVQTPPFTEGTKKNYKRQGIRTKPRFEKTGQLKNSIKPTNRNGIITVSSTGSKNNKDKVKHLLSTKTRGNKTKSSRTIFGLTDTRRKIVADAITRFLKSFF